MFTLFEELLILCIHEEKGTLIGSSIDRLKVGLVGAILAELVIVGKIKSSDNRRLQVVDDNRMDDPVLDGVLHTLRGSEKDRKFGYWINALCEKNKKYRNQIIKSLIQKGIVTQDEDRLLWVIPSPLNLETKASLKYLYIKRLRDIVLAQEDMQPRELVLLSLIRACGLLDRLFLSDECKLADRYINENIFSRAIKDPVFQTIQDLEEAIADAVEED